MTGIMLGDVLAAARRSSSGLDGWLAATDGELALRLCEQAKTAGLSPTGYARMALADFSRFASEEDWATLMSAIRDDTDPGRTCLLAMVNWRMTVSACDRHSQAR